MASVVAAFAIGVLQTTEVTDDEIVYTFQAKTLLEGRITNPPPPGHGNFDNVFMINDGSQWTGHYNGGHPLWLALGVALGSPYVTTFLASALVVLLVYLIGVRLFGDRREAFLASSLLVISPFFTMTCASLLSHSTAALMLSLFVLAFLSGMESRELTWRRIATGGLTGLALGYGFNIRPLTAMAFAAPFGLWMIIRGYMREGRTVAWLGAAGAGFGIVFGLTLLWNRVITGHYLTFPGLCACRTRRFKRRCDSPVARSLRGLRRGAGGQGAVTEPRPGIHEPGPGVRPGRITGDRSGAR